MSQTPPRTGRPDLQLSLQADMKPPEDRLLVVSSQSPEWGLGGTEEAQKVALNKGLDLKAG